MSTAGNRGFENRMGPSGIVEQGKQKAGDLASRATEMASDIASQTREKAQELASSAASQAQHLANQAEDLLENVNRFVRRHPLASIACTLACGMVVGTLLSTIVSKRDYVVRQVERNSFPLSSRNGMSFILLHLV